MCTGSSQSYLKIFFSIDINICLIICSSEFNIGYIILPIFLLKDYIHYVVHGGPSTTDLKQSSSGSGILAGTGLFSLESWENGLGVSFSNDITH